MYLLFCFKSMFSHKRYYQVQFLHLSCTKLHLNFRRKAWIKLGIRCVLGVCLEFSPLGWLPRNVVEAEILNSQNMFYHVTKTRARWLSRQWMLHSMNMFCLLPQPKIFTTEALQWGALKGIDFIAKPYFFTPIFFTPHFF